MRIWLAGLLAAAACAFLGLGLWQIERRAWKLDLIARVEARLAAPPVPAPSPEAWAGLARDADEYRRVRLSGVFDHSRQTLTQAVTELGPGFWVLTPLRTEHFTALVNRGFVPAERRDPASRPEGQIAGRVEIIGLLRFSEPGGGFLRSNDPAQNRWYSRDVAAIAGAREIAAAPYFVDADATPNPGGFPVGGLTVVSFRNPHLVYALTWFALAAMAGWGAMFVWRRPG